MFTNLMIDPYTVVKVKIVRNHICGPAAIKGLILVLEETTTTHRSRSLTSSDLTKPPTTQGWINIQWSLLSTQNKNLNPNRFNNKIRVCYLGEDYCWVSKKRVRRARPPSCPGNRSIGLEPAPLGERGTRVKCCQPPLKNSPKKKQKWLPILLSFSMKILPNCGEPFMEH